MNAPSLECELSGALQRSRLGLELVPAPPVDPPDSIAMNPTPPLTTRSSRWLAFGFALFGFSVAPALGQGALVGWGHNFYGEASAPSSGGDFAQFAGGVSHSIALRNDGSVVSWGSNSHNLVAGTPTGTGFAQVSAGYLHSLVLRDDGSITSWGWDFYGQVSGTPTGTDFVQIDGGLYYSLALRDNGSIVGWGLDFNGEVSGVPPGERFTQVSAGGSHAHGLRLDGSIASWGTDGGSYDFGQVTNTPSGTGFVQVAAGGRFSAALRADGSIVAWGFDSSGQVSAAPEASGIRWATACSARADRRHDRKFKSPLRATRPSATFKAIPSARRASRRALRRTISSGIAIPATLARARASTSRTLGAWSGCRDLRLR